MSLKFCPKCGANLESETQICKNCGFDLKSRPKKENLIQVSERIKTNADFPERWALEFGKKPKERENFQYFKEIELDFPPGLFDPNLLHLKLVHYIEDLNYRIEENQRPINRAISSGGNDYIFSQDLDGAIKGSIKTSKGANYSKKYDNLILGIIFLIIGIVFIIINVLFPNIIYFFIALVLIAIAIYLIFLFFRQKNNDRLTGHSSIYVLERGIVHFGYRKYHPKNAIQDDVVKLPLSSSIVIISIALAVNNMNDKKPEEDLNKLTEKIREYYNLFMDKPKYD